MSFRSADGVGTPSGQCRNGVAVGVAVAPGSAVGVAVGMAVGTAVAAGAGVGSSYKVMARSTPGCPAIRTGDKYCSSSRAYSCPGSVVSRAPVVPAVGVAAG